MKREHLPFPISVPDPSTSTLYPNHGSKQVLRDVFSQRAAGQDDMFVFTVLQVDGNGVILATNFYRDALEDTSLAYRTEFHFCGIFSTGEPKDLAAYRVNQNSSGIVLQQATIYVFCSLLCLLRGFMALDGSKAITHLRLSFPFHQQHWHGASTFNLQQVDAVIVPKDLRKVGKVLREAGHWHARRTEGIYFESIFSLFSRLGHGRPSMILRALCCDLSTP